MNGIVLILIAIAIFVIAYLSYGRWLAKQWGIDPTRKTPAHEMEDGVDYVPAKAPVLLGHHFASIAGAGPINGPIQAAFFGWVPAFLWIIIGGIFFGAVHDFGALFSSVRHKGLSIGAVIEENISKKCKTLFTIFAWLVLILVVAAFGDIVANSFTGSAANGSVATASLLFIPLSIAFGFLVYRKNAPLLVSTIAGCVCLAIAIAIGIAFPIMLPKTFWLGFVIVYIFIASTAPVWILLQPRDYLNSFLLYFMIGAAVVGIIVANPVIQTPAFVGFNVNGQSLFPVLFITVACGAISGFHSLVGSGTTSKQLDNEKDALLIGYGGMLIECVLAVISLIAIGTLSADGSIAATGASAPAVVFATAISNFLATIGLPTSITFTIISLAVSAFALTSLDTATRLGRFMFQELFPKNKTLSNMYVSTAITAGIGFIFCLAGYQNVWPLFGACNQLVAVPAFLALATYLKRKGKNEKMLYIPMIFMLAATLTSLTTTFITNITKLAAGTGALMKEGLQTAIIVPIFILAVILVVEGTKTLIGLYKKN